MNETRNLCAQIPADLHDTVREEKERTGKNLNQYITDLLIEYYRWKEKGGKTTEIIRTLAFQIQEELFQRIKTHLSRESASRGKKLPQRNVDNRRVFAYLRKRGIASQALNGFLEARLFYEDTPYHNCVFVGRNAADKPVFAIKRGAYDKGGSSFKGDVSGSDKNTAFRLPARPDNDAVLVFESPIDMMSYCTLERQIASNAVALCGLHDGALLSESCKNINKKAISFPCIRRPAGKTGMNIFSCASKQKFAENCF